MLCQFGIASTIAYYYQAVSAGTNRSIDFPGGTSDSGTDYVLVTTDFDSANIFNFTTNKGSAYVRAKADTWGASDYRELMSAQDTGAGRGFGFMKIGSNLRFWVGSWNTNYDEVALPSTGTWFNAVGRIEKDGSGVKLCVNGTDGAGDTLTTAISDTFTIPFRIGSANTSGYGSEFDGVIDEAAFWDTYMDDTSKGTLCASGFKGSPASTYASPTKHFKIQSDDVVTGSAGGITDYGSLATGGTGASSLSLSTDVAP